MTDTANTPRTAAEALALAMEADGWEFSGDPVFGALAIIHGLEERGYRIEAEAAAPTPAEPLDVDLLAQAIHSEHSGPFIEGDRRQAERVAARYNRLVAARPASSTPTGEECSECGGAGGVLTDEQGYAERDVCQSCGGSGRLAAQEDERP